MAHHAVKPVSISSKLDGWLLGWQQVEPLLALNPLLLKLVIGREACRVRTNSRRLRLAARRHILMELECVDALALGIQVVS